MMALWIWACSSFKADFTGKGEAGQADSWGADSGEFDGDTLYVDVHPSGGDDLLPQTFVAGPLSSWSGLGLDLSPTVVYAGQVTGFLATPTADISVPGETDVPVLAAVAAQLPGRVSGASARTSDAGRFLLSVPAGRGWQVSVLPDASQLLPFQVVDGVEILEDQSVPYALGYGLPVAGRVSQSGGAPPPAGTMVWLRHSASGVEGSPVEVDADGDYMLRALPGIYDLVVDGPSYTTVPRVEQLGVEVNEEDELVAVDVNLGQVQEASVRGRLLGADGQGLYNATVRLESLELESAEGTDLVETSTDRNGSFTASLMPGRWRALFVPAYSVDGEDSPLVTELQVESSGLNLGEVALAPRVMVSSRLSSGEGEPVPGALITVREQGLLGYSYSTSTDAQGRWSLTLPDTALELIMSPPSGFRGATINQLYSSPDQLPGELALGEGVEVSGQVTHEGEPLPWSLVELYYVQGQVVATTVSDDQGRFSLRVQPR